MSTGRAIRKRFLSSCLFSLTAGAALGGERDVSLAGPGWRFAKDPTCELRAEAVTFDDASWEAVRVPHDWAISGPFDESLPGGTGKLPWKGVGWYRRTFTLKPDDGGASVFLDFDGVMASPEVYVNGRKAGGWDYGYASFRVDATPYVKPGVNTLAVRADTRDHNSRWYPGAGIYRKVMMKVRNAAHFAYNGIFVTTPEVSKDAATVRVAWELEGGVPEGAQVEVRVDAAKTAALHRAQYAVPAAQGRLEGRIEKPALWDVDAPNLYEADVRLVHGGRILSRERVRFGIRRIAFPVPTAGPATNDWAANGFHLNGRRVQFRGVNLHSDLGPLGMAFDVSAMRRQLHIMKDMGVNALRTSHNCPAPEVLDLCDEMGIVVWDEAFDKWDDTAGRRPEQNLEEYVSRNLRQFVRRDRNHPCVVIWSMSNEIVTPGYNDGNYVDGLTKARCTYFREQMRMEDTTRPVGNGNIGWMSRPKYIDENMYDDLDITGWNYGASYRRAKAKYPAKPIVYSESASAQSSYGFYPERLPSEKHDYARDAFQTDGYDFNALPDIADWEFDRMEKDVYCCGEFVWTGIDYLGEPSPYKKESRSSYFGIVDLMGVPKDRYWLYRSYWNPGAYTLHIVPHWTWPGREGKIVPVFVYTNGDSAELFVNGRSMGRRAKGEMPDGEGRPSAYYDICAKYRLMWFAVPYEPGELKAVAYRGGKRIGETFVRTAGEPVAVRLTVEPKLTDSPDELIWVQVDVVDAQGARNPLAMDRVSFRLSGPGMILGVGNGNAHAFEAFTKTDSHPLFYGKAVAVIRRDAPGELKLVASAPGLAPATVEIPDGRSSEGRAAEVRLAVASEKPSGLPPAWADILVQVKSTFDGTLQPCYFWAPRAANTNAVPLIVGLHTWSHDYLSASHCGTVLSYAQKHGWAMVGPNFRGPNKTPPACGGDPAVQDIVDAVNYAKAHVKIDPARVYIAGGSGGGHMTLLMLGRHPEIFAAGAAFCPITDLARWHADSLLDHPGRGKVYAQMLEAACGGTPAEKPEEYAHRSPLTWLDRARKAGVGAYIVTGIHDGWKGSVPVGHSFRAFNALANPEDRVSEADIAAIEETQQVPAALAYDGPGDPFYSEQMRIHFRRTSANVRFTLMEGGHGGNFAAGLDFLARQVKGRSADFSLPSAGNGREEALGK